jgi:hypothetical protein
MQFLGSAPNQPTTPPVNGNLSPIEPPPPTTTTTVTPTGTSKKAAPAPSPSAQATSFDPTVCSG